MAFVALWWSSSHTSTSYRRTTSTKISIHQSKSSYKVITNQVTQTSKSHNRNKNYGVIQWIQYNLLMLIMVMIIKYGIVYSRLGINGADIIINDIYRCVLTGFIMRFIFEILWFKSSIMMINEIFMWSQWLLMVFIMVLMVLNCIYILAAGGTPYHSFITSSNSVCALFILEIYGNINIDNAWKIFIIHHIYVINRLYIQLPLVNLQL